MRTPAPSLLLVSALSAVAACGGPARTAFVRYPGAPVAFEPAQSDPKAVALADKVFAAAGGPGHWDAAKQIKWKQTTMKSGTPTLDGEEAWDRWDGKHWGLIHQGDDSMIAIHDVYGDFSSAWSEDKQGHNHLMEQAGRDQAVKVARDAFKIDTTLMCLPFMLHEPGATLHYGGVVQADGKQYEQLDLAFAPADEARAGYTFTAYVDPTTFLIYRAEVHNTATNAREGFVLKDWTTVNGLQFAATRQNLGDATQTVQIKGITVGEPDDSLYIPPIT